MFDFLGNLQRDLHPIIVHFPIALLVLSFTLSLFWQRNERFNAASWLLLVVGGFATLPAVVTGLISHLPYEDTTLAGVIEQHQLLGLIGSALTLGLLTWRYRSRRKGNDVGSKPYYLAIAGIGIVWLVVLGGTGGNLVYEYGVNVDGINPLLGSP